MELNNENMKKIRHLIVFTALIILCFWKYEMVIQAVKFVISVLFPFILGGAIAFVFNVPMHFVENRLIQECAEAVRFFTPQRYSRCLKNRNSSFWII